MLEEITPGELFQNTIFAGRPTKAVYIAETAAGTAYTMHCDANGLDVGFVTGGQFLPLRITTAITLAGHTIVYIY